MLQEILNRIVTEDKLGIGGSFLSIYRNRKDLEPTNEERHIIKKVIEYIKQEYNLKRPMPLITFRVFEPLTAKWKEALNYNWGSNAVGSDIILLTRCRDTKAFYEVVFHELYEWLTNQNHDDVILEERKYIEKKFDTKLGDREWSPLQDEMIRSLYPSETEHLEEILANQSESGRFNRKPAEIEQRAKELGLIS
jgi:hypothetical protein